MPQQPRFLPLKPVTPAELSRIPDLPTAKQLKTTFPQRSLGAAEARAALKRVQEAQPVPTAPRNPRVSIKALPVTPAMLNELRDLANGDVPADERARPKLDQKVFFGAVYSALTAYEFMKLESEYKRRKGSGIALAAVEQNWKGIVKAAQMAYAATGLRGLQEADLSRFAKTLGASRPNLDAVAQIANSATDLTAGPRLSASTNFTASFVPSTGKFIETLPFVTSIANLCDKPFAQGSYTKHFAYSYALRVNITYWCPTWDDWFRTCTKTVTLAGVSFSLDLNVGYKVNCCGATAWGQAAAQACGTLFGFTVCASCTATITAVAGVSRTPVGSNCSYGLGVTAVLQCQFAGATVFYASVPFGWTVTGPCPPPGLC